jgi:hypothetical protein
MKRIVLWVSTVFFLLPTPGGFAQPGELTPAPEDSFSIVVLPDTQVYTRHRPHELEKQIHWILDNIETQQIQFVSHVGDIVDEYNSDEEWEVAHSQLMKLHGKVPFAFSVGNHDMLSSGDATRFHDNFPASLFRQFNWYGGDYKDNSNSFQLISAGGLDLLLLHLECNAPDEVLEWASGVLKEHRDRHAIITTHMYLGPLERPTTKEGWFDDPKGRMKWHKIHGEKGNSPQDLWEKCFSKHKNLFLICCGDQSRTQAMRRTAIGIHENEVYECLSDYGGNGCLRIYRFLPRRNEIQAITYNTTLGKLCEGTKIVDDREEHQFTLTFRMEQTGID